MGDKIALALDERTLHGKKVKILRGEGLVPVVIYGPDIEPISAQVASGVMLKTYKQAGTHAPVHLVIAGDRKMAMIKDVDFDPVKGTIRHVSFHAVRATDPIVAEVPIVLDGEGESEAEKNGLIVLQTLEKIEIRALPMDLPDALRADIRGLKEAGEKLLLESITLPENVELVERESGHGDDDEEHHRVGELVIASVWEPSALQAANEATAGDGEDESAVASDNGEAAEDTTADDKAQDESKKQDVDAKK